MNCRTVGVVSQAERLLAIGLVFVQSTVWRTDKVLLVDFGFVDFGFAAVADSVDVVDYADVVPVETVEGNWANTPETTGNCPHSKIVVNCTCHSLKTGL